MNDSIDPLAKWMDEQQVAEELVERSPCRGGGAGRPGGDVDRVDQERARDRAGCGDERAPGLMTSTTRLAGTGRTSATACGPRHLIANAPEPLGRARTGNTVDRQTPQGHRNQRHRPISSRVPSPSPCWCFMAGVQAESI